MWNVFEVNNQNNVDDIILVSLQISHIHLVFPSMTLRNQMPAQYLDQSINAYPSAHKH